MGENTLLDTGFDATLWNGLLSIELDAFYNYTYDVLTGMGGGKPSSMGGYYPTYGNHNALDSKGIDILLSHRSKFQLAGSPLQYNISGNLTYSKTRWLKYLDDPNIMEWQKMVGTTYGTIYGWKADGLFRSEEEIDNSAWYGSRPCVGDIKYVDMNGDGKIDSQDRGAFGRSNRPQLTFGLNIGASWKGFDFNAQFTGGALFDVSLTGTYITVMMTIPFGHRLSRRMPTRLSSLWRMPIASTIRTALSHVSHWEVPATVGTMV